MGYDIEGAAKTLNKGDRSRVDVGPLVPVCDRLVDVILPDGGADDGRDFGGQVR